MTVKDLILELANYHWPGNKKFPSGYMAEVLVKDPDAPQTLPVMYRSVTEAGWVSEHEYDEEASSSPLIMPGKLPGGWKNSCHSNPYRRLLGLQRLLAMTQQEIHKCRQECRDEDARLGRGRKEED